MASILVVDDSVTMRTQLELALTAAHFTVHLAPNGRAALRVVSHSQIDAVITDINMPDMNGFELIKALRTQSGHARTPIFVLTTEASPVLKAKGKAVGATAWIIKPFNPATLVRALKRVTT
ncbi:MAG: response regulator [Myxococcales bacterium]|nr:response regulator [Myxococcales bacterium]